MQNNNIGTHDGKFHCDEVFGCVLLKQLPEFKDASIIRTQFKDASIIRTRDPEILKQCKLILDVGGIYDPTKLRFDHHQREFKETMKSLKALDFDTKLSSAGLIYHYFGRRVLAILLHLDLTTHEEILNKLYAKLYEDFVHSVDAIDNGISQFDGTPRYKLSSTLNSRVNNLNPAWNEQGTSPDIQFEKAMKIVEEEFFEKVKYAYRNWLPALELIHNAVEKRFENHPSGKVLVLSDGGCPWKEHFFNIENEKALKGEDISYVCYPDNANNWRIQAIPVDAFSAFENRCPLPEAWRGYRDKELSDISGIEGCIFVHMSGFIGGHKNKEGILKMADKAL
uniref:Uncharacterized protein n=1 Tax=Panagrolaimus sp. ES5 TaxID=591445 RepID=A0AC34GA46_9BILA